MELDWSNNLANVVALDLLDGPSWAAIGELLGLPDLIGVPSPTEFADALSAASADGGMEQLVGGCAHISGSMDVDGMDLVGAVAACLYDADDAMGIAFASEIGIGASTASVRASGELGLGAVFSNASNLDQLAGNSVCFSVSVGGKPGVGSVTCFGIAATPDEVKLTGVVSQYMYGSMRSVGGAETSLSVTTTEFKASTPIGHEMAPLPLGVDPAKYPPPSEY